MAPMIKGKMFISCNISLLLSVMLTFMSRILYLTHNGMMYFTGRAHDSSQGLVPGKVVAFWKGFYYPLFGAERHLTQYEILVTDHPEMFKWVSASGCKYMYLQHLCRLFS